MKKALPDDATQLVELMAEFYAESGHLLNRAHAIAAFSEVLRDDRLGRVWLIEAESQAAGYMTLTFGYSMEYGGLHATLDDLFIRAPFRGAGLGTAAMSEMRAFCAASEIRAVSVEVGRDNPPAHVVYRRAGFLETDRQLLTLELAKPAHAL